MTDMTGGSKEPSERVCNLGPLGSFKHIEINILSDLWRLYMSSLEVYCSPPMRSQNSVKLQREF